MSAFIIPQRARLAKSMVYRYLHAVRARGPVAIVVILGAVSAGLAVHRLRRTPEQKELTHYVEVELPGLERLENPLLEKIDRLSRAPGMKPEEARKLLVDEIIPQLLRTRKSVEEYQPETDEVRALHQEYQAMLDQLLEACRTSVRVIDDPKVSTAAGASDVFRQFKVAKEARTIWQTHVEAACRRHRLVGVRP
jgi:hypothetical protein